MDLLQVREEAQRSRRVPGQHPISGSLLSMGLVTPSLGGSQTLCPPAQ